MKTLWYFLILLGGLASCTASKNFNPSRKYSPRELNEDYTLFRKILEESHPSLYWYTPKDSMDMYFNKGASLLKDSLPEYKFRNVLSYVLSQVHCGHTTVRASKGATNYSERTRGFAFPLNLKIWNDTAVITSSLNIKDSNLKRGMLLTSISKKPIKNIVDSLFQHLSGDGYNTTHKFQTLSNPGSFRNLYGAIYGLRTEFQIGYTDLNGVARETSVALFNPRFDTLKTPRPAPVKISRKERKRRVRESQRRLRIDSATHTAFIDLNSFTKKYNTRGFLRRSFRTIRKEQIPNLVVDMRSNGGGSVVLSNLLTKYISKKPFKVADSLYAIRRKTDYGRYQNSHLFNRIFLIFMTHKKSDGFYHFGLYENKYFKLKSRNHFEGTCYILTGGNTFSAATLFTKALKNQPNVTIVGEETGGGAYGNSAWLIPDVTLPNTQVRFRLPLFRLVIDRDANKGYGVLPDVEADPSINDIRRNVDYKMEKVIKLIKEKQKS